MVQKIVSNVVIERNLHLTCRDLFAIFLPSILAQSQTRMHPSDEQLANSVLSVIETSLKTKKFLNKMK